MKVEIIRKIEGDDVLIATFDTPTIPREGEHIALISAGSLSSDTWVVENVGHMVEIAEPPEWLGCVCQVIPLEEWIERVVS